jgi:hypothetical protein
MVFPDFLSFETQSCHRKFKCGKIQVVGLNLWRHFSYMGNVRKKQTEPFAISKKKQTHNIKIFSQYQKNHEQEREHPCHVPC